MRLPVETYKLTVKALEDAIKAMNEFLNGDHYNPTTGRNDTYFSNPLDACEKALYKLKYGQKAYHVSEMSKEDIEAIRNAEVPPGNEHLNDELLECTHQWEHLHGYDKDNEYRCALCGERK